MAHRSVLNRQARGKLQSQTLGDKIRQSTSNDFSYLDRIASRVHSQASFSIAVSPSTVPAPNPIGNDRQHSDAARGEPMRLKG
jgi:hypothetical protein